MIRSYNIICNITKSNCRKYLTKIVHRPGVFSICHKLFFWTLTSLYDQVNIYYSFLFSFLYFWDYI